MKFTRLAPVLVAAALAGCAGYRWTSDVPAAMRTVTVPTFRNSSKVTELGAVATTQLLRELQRNGTFKIADGDEAALEIQGETFSGSISDSASIRRINNRRTQGAFLVSAKISVIDRARGKVLIDNRVYEGSALMSTDGDTITANRDASGRACDDLARKIVDDLNVYPWGKVQ